MICKQRTQPFRRVRIPTERLLKSLRLSVCTHVTSRERLNRFPWNLILGSSNLLTFQFQFRSDSNWHEDDYLLGCFVRRWWRQQAPLKRQSISTRLHGPTSQKTAIFILAALRNWNVTTISGTLHKNIRACSNLQNFPAIQKGKCQILGSAPELLHYAYIS
jgi:hypothetical protein